MGQKVSPVGLRIGINKTWSSTWVAGKKDISKNILEDNNIRKYLKKKYYSCGISKIDIARSGDTLTVDIHTGRPGVLIGQKGAGIEAMRKELDSMTEAKNVNINIKEVKNLDLDAKLVAEGIALQLEKRAQFRRVMKQTVQRTMRAGAQGIKVIVSGRLDGADIARSEGYTEGTVPLQTIRADVDYATAEADTTYGKIGVKVWIYKGEILNKRSRKEGGNDDVNAKKN